jgi:16S rRNA (adenine1518-N6/adenine1519-N6)-dimethyltransferase
MAAKYGQHFLINTHAVERIIDSLALTKTDTVLEIGPGKGVLTQYLVARAGRVVTVEIDPEMVQKLTTKFTHAKNLEIVPSDILDFDLDALPKLDAPCKIVGNLPYNLTSPILRQFSSWKKWSFAIAMMQKEVGDRVCARVGTAEYGALTVGMNLVTLPEHVFDLSESSFAPKPRVKSSVVKFTRRAEPLTDDVTTTQKVIQAAFQQRRKTVLNSLSHGLGLTKEQTTALLKAVGVDPGIRAERISVPTFIELSHVFKQQFYNQ